MESYYLTPLFGSIAGLVADVSTHPVATVKTRLQVQGSQKGMHSAAKGMSKTASQQLLVQYTNPFQASLHMFRNEGIFSFFKGVGAVVGGAPFASALYFSGVELTKSTFGHSSVTLFCSGVIGQLMGSLAWVPMDVLKERCQVEGQVKTVIPYKSSWGALQGILKHEGVLGLYRAYWIHQLTWAPFNGMYWMTYGQCKKWLQESSENSTDSVSIFLISSTYAGAVSSFVTSPLDLVKTRMQVQRANPNLFDFNNPFQCAVKVWQREGFLSFFDGVLARVLWLTPRYIVAVSMFDYLKNTYIDASKDDSDIDVREAVFEA